MKNKNKLVAILFLVLAFGASLAIFNQAFAQQTQPPLLCLDNSTPVNNVCANGSAPVHCAGNVVNGQCNTCPAGQSGTPCVLTNPAPGQLINESDFGSLLKRLVNILLMFAGAIAVVFLVIGGFQYVASHGNEEITEKAKKTITNAVIGIVIIVMAFAVVAIINNLLTADKYTPTVNGANIRNTGEQTDGLPVR